MSFYGYTVETEGDNPRLWSFRLSDTANTIREYLKELMDELKRCHASLYDQQSEKGLMEQTAKILFSDTAATAVASLSMQKWCPFQNPADLRQQFDQTGRLGWLLCHSCTTEMACCLKRVGLGGT